MAIIDDKKEDEEGFGEYRKVAQKPDGTWCIEQGSWGGDSGGIEICLTPGRGLTRIASYFSGGSSIDEWFELR